VRQHLAWSLRQSVTVQAPQFTLLSTQFVEIVGGFVTGGTTVVTGGSGVGVAAVVAGGSTVITGGSGVGNFKAHVRQHLTWSFLQSATVQAPQFTLLSTQFVEIVGSVVTGGSTVVVGGSGVEIVGIAVTGGSAVVTGGSGVGNFTAHVRQHLTWSF